MQHIDDDARRAPTILLAEDEVAQRVLYTRILIAAGYYVLGVDNGDDAVRLTRQEQPGLVLMDVTMPLKDGLTATRELKTDEQTRHIPVILMTGHSASRANVASAPSDAMLAKPISVRHLLDTVMSFLPTI